MGFHTYSRGFLKASPGLDLGPETLGIHIQVCMPGVTYLPGCSKPKIIHTNIFTHEHFHVSNVDRSVFTKMGNPKFRTCATYTHANRNQTFDSRMNGGSATVQTSYIGIIQRWLSHITNFNEDQRSKHTWNNWLKWELFSCLSARPPAWLGTALSLRIEEAWSETTFRGHLKAVSSESQHESQHEIRTGPQRNHYFSRCWDSDLPFLMESQHHNLEEAR